MKKIAFFFFFLSIIYQLLFDNLFAQEQIEILTYYPAPYGAYKNITLSENLILPSSTTAPSGGNLGAGIIYTGADRFIHRYGTNNFFAGALAGNFTMTGNDNTAVGYNSLNSNTAGLSNTGIGVSTLASNTIGSQNTAVGYQALMQSSAGVNNAALGCQALSNNQTSGDNTAVGALALFNNTTRAFQ